MPYLPKILIVDDDLTNIRFLNEVLGDEYQIKSVSTGEEALEIIEDFSPDLMLLDIMLPGMDGYEVCQRIKNEEKYSEIKIILISAKAMDFEMQKGYDVGGDAYITKPFDHFKLLNQIASML